MSVSLLRPLHPNLHYHVCRTTRLTWCDVRLWSGTRKRIVDFQYMAYVILVQRQRVCADCVSIRQTYLDTHIVGYWQRITGTQRRFTITGWDGIYIADGYVTREYVVRGFYGTRHTRYAIYTIIDGYHWYGTGYGDGMYLTLKRGKKVKEKDVPQTTATEHRIPICEHNE